MFLFHCRVQAHNNSQSPPIMAMAAFNEPGSMIGLLLVKVPEAVPVDGDGQQHSPTTHDHYIHVEALAIDPVYSVSSGLESALLERLGIGAIPWLRAKCLDRKLKGIVVEWRRWD